MALRSVGFIALALAAPATAQVAIPMTTDRWVIDGNAAFEVKDGRSALRLGSDPGKPRTGGVAAIKDFEFASGVIEFDMMLPDNREFSGPLFRQSAGGGEYVYFRPHLNGKPDAIQYTPVVNGSLAWQIFTGPGFEAEITFPVERWMRVRLDVFTNSATLAVDGQQVLRMPELKSGVSSGALGFGSLIGGAYYSNLVVRPIANYQDPSPPPAAIPFPAGTVKRWQVAGPLTQDDGLTLAAGRNWKGLSWHPIAVESNGIANLSKAGPDGADRHTFVARFTAHSRIAKRARLEFGFSDQVRVYLNGQPVYEGADLQGSRDYRFLGHVGFWDALFLPLQPGENDIAFVVTDETNGGTAAAARIDPDPDIRVE